MNMKPVPAIFDLGKVINQNSKINNATSMIVSRRSIRIIYFQGLCLNESFSLGGYDFRKNDDRVLFYKLKCQQKSK